MKTNFTVLLQRIAIGIMKYVHMQYFIAIYCAALVGTHKIVLGIQSPFTFITFFSLHYNYEVSETNVSSIQVLIRVLRYI